MTSFACELTERAKEIWSSRSSGAFRRCLGFAAILVLSGCARFQYRIVEPASLAQTLGKQEVRVSRESLEYRFADLDGYLGIGILNSTDKPVTLVGDKSYVVDPRQRTRPLRGGMIAPRSYIDMTLPPPPFIYREEPSFRFGFGLGYSSFHRPRPFLGSRFRVGIRHHPFFPVYDPLYDPFYDRPTHYQVTTPAHWEWNVGEVRVHLSYDHASTNAFEHDFTFVRERVK
ncbi:MAG: hypothetical protein FJ403_17160 [Verrucomicrobia bacterium]|nr:hypothetical protein [Verrucomicrobiota bacterium]